jgi:hypothetical protein
MDECTHEAAVIGTDVGGPSGDYSVMVVYCPTCEHIVEVEERRAEKQP